MITDRVVIFGEVLFDSFPDGSQILGGAPFNVAWHLKAFGLHPLFITRIGNDAAGTEVHHAMAEWEMDTSGVQVDPQLPTGQVQVQFDQGEPQYTILHPAAFDAIEYPHAASAARNQHGEQRGEQRGDQCALLYHGSLALRCPASRESLEKLRDELPVTTFIDVNLRAPWWQRESILDWVVAADWVKLNEHELRQLGGSGESAQDQAARILTDYGMAGVILTRGEAGADLLTAQGTACQVRPQNDIQLVDTVGAGDAFTSVMLLGLLKQWPGELTLKRAQDFASQVCCYRGATVRDKQFYKALAKGWNLDE